MSDYNKMPEDMEQITASDFVDGVNHYVLGKPDSRQPYIGVSPMSGTINLRMFPLGYGQYEHLGYAVSKVRIVKGREDVVYYRYGKKEDWESLRKGMVAQFAGDYS